ncbi:MAG TPA: cardiolipin synthase, partial [Porticoccaceae bacterium]|nr:cardiolipin synthase [Porticoccaceae bacterium]
VDDDTTYIGSANLDNRSFRLNFELTVITRDRAFASEVEEMLVEDFSHSHEISSAQLLQRSYLFLVAARMARLFSPLQ